MTEDELNGTLAKARAYARLVWDLGLGPIAFVVMLLMVTGYVRSPLATESSLIRHDERLKLGLESRIARDTKLNDTMERIAAASEQQIKINRSLLCFIAARDDRGRQECLR